MREYMTGNEVLKKDIVLLLEKKKKIIFFLSFFLNSIKYIYIFLHVEQKKD